MDVLVAAGAPLRREDRDRAAVVVAAQAARVGMRAAQRHAGLLRVVELEVLGEDVPPLAHVAELAVGREGVVGEDRAELRPPAMTLAPCCRA